MTVPFLGQWLASIRNTSLKEDESVQKHEGKTNKQQGLKSRKAKE